MLNGNWLPLTLLLLNGNTFYFHYFFRRCGQLALQPEIFTQIKWNNKLLFPNKLLIISPLKIWNPEWAWRLLCCVPPIYYVTCNLLFLSGYLNSAYHKRWRQNCCAFHGTFIARPDAIIGLRYSLSPFQRSLPASYILDSNDYRCSAFLGHFIWISLLLRFPTNVVSDKSPIRWEILRQTATGLDVQLTPQNVDCDRHSLSCSLGLDLHHTKLSEWILSGSF